jgi:hypothetical protein
MLGIVLKDVGLSLILSNPEAKLNKLREAFKL